MLHARIAVALASLGGVAIAVACSAGPSVGDIEPAALAGTYRVESAVANVRATVRVKDGSFAGQRDSVFIVGGDAFECGVRLLVRRGRLDCGGFELRVIRGGGVFATYRDCRSRQVPYERTERDPTTGATRTIQDERTVTECRQVPAKAEKLP